MKGFKKNNGSILIYVVFGVLIIVSVFLLSLVVYRDYIVVNQFKSSNAQINRISSIIYNTAGEKEAESFAKDLFYYFNPNAKRYLDGSFVINIKKNKDGSIENNTIVPLKLPSVFNKILPNNELKAKFEAQSKFTLGEKSPPLSISFILDYSASMAGNRVNKLKLTVTKLLTHMSGINKKMKSNFFRVGLYPFQFYTYAKDSKGIYEEVPFYQSSSQCNNSTIKKFINFPDSLKIQSTQSFQCKLNNVRPLVPGYEYILHKLVKETVLNGIKIGYPFVGKNGKVNYITNVNKTHIYNVPITDVDIKNVDLWAYKNWDPNVGENVMTNSLYGILSSINDIRNEALRPERRKRIVIMISDGEDALYSDNSISEVCKLFRTKLDVEFYQIMFDKKLNINPYKKYGCVLPQNSMVISSADALSKAIFNIVNKSASSPIMTKV